MVRQMTESEVRTSTDVDRLWKEFLAARQRGDGATAELVRARMAELQEQEQLRALDDDQLLARIEQLQARDQDEDVHVLDLTGTPPGPVARLSALLAEAGRRGL